MDPFNQHSEKSLWESLEKVQLKELIQDLKGGLDYEVQKGGSNLSVGQKQVGLNYFVTFIASKQSLIYFNIMPAHVLS